MGIWRPPTTQLERSTRSVRSMSAGTLDGRVVSALPINRSFGSGGEGDGSGAFGPTILPYTDYFKPSTGGNPQFKLTYLPYSPTGTTVNTLTFYVYWNNVFQKENSYTLSSNLLTLTDPDQLIRTDDVIIVKYWYDSSSPYGTAQPATVIPFPSAPTHFYNHIAVGPGAAGGFYTYAEAITNGADPDWLDWVVDNFTVSSTGSIQYSTPPLDPDFYQDFKPVWIFPTSGEQCRFSFDSAKYTLPDTDQFWLVTLDITAATFNAIQNEYLSDEWYKWDRFDIDFRSGTDLDINGNSEHGTEEKQWTGWYLPPDYDYDPTKIATSFPPEASERIKATSDGLRYFQRPPFISTTPLERATNDHIDDPGDSLPITQRAYAAFYFDHVFWRAVGSGAYVDYDFEMTGLKMLRGGT